MTTTPTVVLVHGAFADASSWSAVLEHLLRAGVSAQAVSNPLRGLSYDGEYVASAVEPDRRCRSCSSATRTAARSSPTPAARRTTSRRWCTWRRSGSTRASARSSRSPGSRRPSSEARSTSRPSRADGGAARRRPTSSATSYHGVFAADVSAGARPRSPAPASVRPPSRPSRTSWPCEPAWKKLPSWFAVATADHAIDPDVAARRGEAPRLDHHRDRGLALHRREPVGRGRRPHPRGGEGRQLAATSARSAWTVPQLVGLTSRRPRPSPWPVALAAGRSRAPLR